MKIMIDAGHGYQTLGKQTPDGMKEYIFNRSVAAHLKNYLKGFKDTYVYFAHSDHEDVPLRERANKANTLSVDVYLSIHANAAGSGGWHAAKGIETYIYSSKPREAFALANCIQLDLVSATGLKNRGIKTAEFHVLRYTKCPSLLIECGFMTNHREAALLKSEIYRRTCATSIGTSIVQFYSLTKK